MVGTQERVLVAFVLDCNVSVFQDQLNLSFWIATCCLDQIRCLSWIIVIVFFQTVSFFSTIRFYYRIKIFIQFKDAKHKATETFLHCLLNKAEAS